MFGFGKKDEPIAYNPPRKKEPPKEPEPPKEQTLEQVYNIYDADVVDNCVYHGFGTRKLDYVFRKYAPELTDEIDGIYAYMRHNQDVDKMREQALLWQGRYLELNEQFKILMKQNEDLRTQLAKFAESINIKSESAVINR